ncbi:phosphoadenylyl-sulfate reductase [Acidisoma cellulosilytica]|uniref:Adenosine 5'-phosphosulfate reductase n=1 Tax=Acidisoma cellulosilyticum TaxID=2802395 RepID=A0A963Z3V6_9PROT|nr:phosphoadenylyl-sulfate reductase [Acidisoma cellulosilyticum]MCB8882292.1 phosphoadenylyl-sulfate reductase [Acidisoma cellulosilyticum]
MVSASASLRSPAEQISRQLCADLDRRIADPMDASAILRVALTEAFDGSIALVSSFGTESALLLQMAAEIDRSVPVIFLDTGKLFPETLEYRDQLVDQLGLTDIRVITPRAVEIARQDAEGKLWRDNADRCCSLRKTQPLNAALDGFDAWITGRKRFQSLTRASVGLFETAADGKIKVNPLAHWSVDQIAAEFDARDLPHHPLEAFGFLSVGCTTCTAPVAAGEDRRAGRWRGMAKTECGIHLPEPAFA